MKVLIALVFLIAPFVLSAQSQYADTAYVPPSFEAKYEAGTGPVIFVDEGHNNFHTTEGRYAPFAKILQLDGYRVKPFNQQLLQENLSDLKILVISNARPPENIINSATSTVSAFTSGEIEALQKWVAEGGSLFLIADHKPFPGFVSNLADAFGYKFYDGFANDTSTQSGAELFVKANNSLSSNDITNGVAGYFKIDSIMTYTGQAFIIPAEAKSILNCGPDWIINFQNNTHNTGNPDDIISADGFSQGAYQLYGKGKLVVFGEAAMFSAQIADFNERQIKAGMNSPRAVNNHKLLINLIRWLDQ